MSTLNMQDAEVERSKPQTSPALRKIHTTLLATDGTVHAERALLNTIHLVQHSGGNLIIVYYADPNDTALFGAMGCTSSEAWEQQGKLVLEQLEKKARDAGLTEVSVLLEPYKGEEGLSLLATKVQADVVVMASHLFCLG
ncbi:MAG: universal stress protein [Chloroflexi bacterium]|uniref:Universal stress protein n=1 Tax=Candidatus Chlorohelix allophototropha TaxID=3003348 RepID=A0A8T7M8N4_9CHLR|nr:universal stress protein [Chloroflexota bacterium]WJW68335.1 universal stress protein [Chloroflexota bacterium L227-S17]